MAAGDGGDVRFSIGIDTAGASNAFKNLEQLSSSAAKKAISQWTRELGSLDSTTARIAEEMLKMAGRWDDRVVSLKRAEVQLRRELDLQRQIADQAERIARANARLTQTNAPGFVSSASLASTGIGLPQRPVGSYGPTLTPQQRRGVDFANQRRELEQFGDQLSRVFGNVIRDVRSDADAARFNAAAFNAGGRPGYMGDAGYFYGADFGAPVVGGMGRRGGGGGGGGGGNPDRRGQRRGRGAYQDEGRRYQAAIQQLLFAADDAIVSFGTGGVSGAIRGASNNVTSFASLLGGPFGLAIGIGVGAIAQLGASVFNMTKNTNDAAKAEEKLADARAESARSLSDIASELAGAGVSGRTTAVGASAGRAFSISEAARQEQARLLGAYTEEFGYRGTDAVSAQSAAAFLGRREPGTSREANQLLSDYMAALNPTQRGLQANAVERERAFIRQQDLEQFGIRYAPGVEARARQRGELSGLGGMAGETGRGLTARLEELGLREDSLFQLFDADRIGLNEYAEAIADITREQNALNEEMRSFSDYIVSAVDRFNTTKQLTDAFEGQAGGVFADRRTRQEITDFIIGGLGKGLTDAEVAGFARERFGVKEDPLGEDGILSKANVGASALRSGGDEFGRLLSGEDSGRKLVTVNEEQLQETKKANAILEEQLANQLQVAGP